MQETRYDWLADQWVLFAPNRDQRPSDFTSLQVASALPSENCPFCLGSEHSCPEPTLVLPHTNLEETRILRRDRHDRTVRKLKQEWRVRVVPNKYPAVVADSVNEPFSQPAAFAQTDFRARAGVYANPITKENRTEGMSEAPELMLDMFELYRREAPTGVHEVIIESPDHITNICSLSVDDIELILQAFQLRLQHFRSQSELQYGVIFKNYGFDAGASLSHSHSQLVCLGFVPSDVERRHQRLLEYFEKHEACYFCHLASEEERVGERVVFSTDHFLVYCPFASRFAFEITIHPRKHRSHFDESTTSELKNLAIVLRSTLLAIERRLPNFAYNLILNTSPFKRFHPLAHHWNLQIIPRSSKVAGFELGSGCYINTVKPETASKLLAERCQ